MNIILSRKGFDSTAGARPSPELLGRLVSLPILAREGESVDRYRDIPSGTGLSLHEIMLQLGMTRLAREGQKIPLDEAFAHWDPRIGEHVPGTLGVLGHKGAIAKRLKTLGVGVGDVFLFFGWFRSAEANGGSLQWKRPKHQFHALWGYLSVGEILDLKDATDEQLRGFAWHTHARRFAAGLTHDDTLYVASPRLRLGTIDIPGSGHLRYSQVTRLTAPDERRRSRWRLPAAFHPDETGIDGLGRMIGARERFAPDDSNVLIDSGGRGQEFVILNASDDVLSWLGSVLSHRG